MMDKRQGYRKRDCDERKWDKKKSKWDKDKEKESEEIRKGEWNMRAIGFNEEFS